MIGLQPGSLTQQYREQLEPVNARAAETWGADWAEKVFPVNRKQMLMGNPAGDENYYMVPQESQVLVIWYNRKLFEKLGITVPKTYDELKAAAKTLTDGWLHPDVPGRRRRLAERERLSDAGQPVLARHRRQGAGRRGAVDLARAGLGDEGLEGRSSTTASSSRAPSARMPIRPARSCFAQGRVGMMALGSWWMQESKFPPPLSEFVAEHGRLRLLLPAAGEGRRTPPSPPVGGIDIGYGLTKNGGKNPAAWTFLAELTNGVGLQEALNDLNDLPAFEGHAPEGRRHRPRARQMYDRFMADLPKAENQRFASPAVAEALDNALAGVAAGSLEPEAALASSRPRPTRRSPPSEHTATGALSRALAASCREGMMPMRTPQPRRALRASCRPRPDPRCAWPLPFRPAGGAALRRLHRLPDPLGRRTEPLQPGQGGRTLSGPGSTTTAPS